MRSEGIIVLEDLYRDTIPVNKEERSLFFPLNLVIQASSIQSSQFRDKKALRSSFFRGFSITYLSSLTFHSLGQNVVKELFIYLFI